MSERLLFDCGSAPNPGDSVDGLKFGRRKCSYLVVQLLLIIPKHTTTIGAGEGAASPKIQKRTTRVFWKFATPVVFSYIDNGQ